MLITLLGWLAMPLGLMRMAAPELAQQAVQNTAGVHTGLAVLLMIGGFLTFPAYRKESAEPAARGTMNS